MSKLFVFGIGGTGSRVLRSFTMLLAAGVEMNVEEVVPIIIDPDASNADLTRTVELMNLYQSVRSTLEFSTGEVSFFSSKLTRILPNYNLLIKETNSQTFQQFIDLAGMDKASQAMMRMLFSEKNLNSSMNVGFKGNPNVGSIVLNQLVYSEDFTDFANQFESGDKIIILSSIFGGTGASGFPLLLKTLRTGNSFPNYDIINKAEIGAVTILPYFKLEQDAESEIDSSTFISKTKAALAYYEQNISKNGDINALYYLADNITNTYQNHEGGTLQQNDAHLIEFFAATAIVDFCNKTVQEGVTLNKELGLKDLSGAVTFASFYDEQKQLLFAPLTRFMLMNNCLTHKFDYFSSPNFNANSTNFKNLYTSPFMNNLRSFLRKYVEWLGELKNNNRSLDLFNLEPGKDAFEIITGIKPGRVLSLKSNYDLVADRLNTALKKCSNKDNESKFLEMFYRGASKLIEDKFKE